MRCPAVLLVLSLAACGAPMSASFQGTSPQPSSLTLKCAAAAADSLGYKPTFTQHGKTLEAIHKDSVLAPYEDGRNEKITAVGADSKKDPGSSTFTITAATFSLHWTRIGLESQEIPASEKVKADGKTIAARCGGAAE
jgi:hypothetical protein